MKVKILFTQDLHDRLEGFTSMEDGKEKKIAGYSRLYSKIKEEREGYEDSSLLLDGGDFTMGTLYQTIFKEEAPSLRMLGYMGYDIATLGNHEFDFRAGGLAKSLSRARSIDEKLPDLVFSNANFKQEVDSKNLAGLESLKEAFKEYPVEEYKIVEKNSVRIGVFGIMGDSAIKYAPMAGISFDDYIESSKEIVKKLQEQDVDLIICLSHAGINEDLKASEDIALARRVRGIDLIISAHSHIEIEEPIHVRDSIIVGAGSYGENLGVLEIEKKDRGWEVLDYRLEAIDSSLEEDPYIKSKLDYFKTKVQELYLDGYGLGFDEVLAKTDRNIDPVDRSPSLMGEEKLANLIGDSYIYTVKEIEGEDYEPITASVVIAGMIRDSFYQGDISVSQVFNVSALGTGKDGLSGYPLVNIYLTGRELKMLAELDASIFNEVSGGELFISGLSYTVNPHRGIFNKVTRVELDLAKDIYMEIDEDKLYRLVTGLYTGKMLALISKESRGLVRFILKDRKGIAIENLEDEIIYQEDGRELKEWYALAYYLKSFRDEEDGSPGLIDDYYHHYQDRKIIEDDPSLVGRIKNPNSFTRKILAAIISAIVAGILAAGYIRSKAEGDKKFRKK